MSSLKTLIDFSLRPGRRRTRSPTSGAVLLDERNGEPIALSGDPQRDAERLLAAAWIRDGEIRLPVDPFAIAERLGIAVYATDLNDNVSGMLVKRAWADPAIHLSADDHRNRQRFTCAHELGHYRRRSEDPDGEAFEYVDHRDEMASRGDDPEEVYANRFAANLLMPATAVQKLVAELGDDATALAVEFGVSPSAMSNRLDTLRRQRQL